ncbi:hypothetical protein HNP99_001125 [Flavobacterium sp. 28A]|uniref:hypothetical protein n=1 Tax=Flavobacterium sp. 28A TaxID=2735895 RepID=UPI001570C1E0|nr:hypothetical protein [Flavobacterium sp. 28A]NRT14781.1 hypothetical protein [Flavobacterium sp. 28A]
MTIFLRNYSIFLIFLSFFGCSTSKQLTNYYTEDKAVNLFAFVGKKIAVKAFDPNAAQIVEKNYDSITGETLIKKSYIMDHAYRCKYVIIKNVFNNPKLDTIDFVAYDHYGSPSFAEFETVLLYVSKSAKGNDYFQQKYQFDYLEKNSDGIFYGYSNTRKVSKKRILFKKNRMASIEELFKNKKEEVFQSLFVN